MRTICSLCGRNFFTLELPHSKVSQENSIRESLVSERLGHKPDRLEAMDLTSFMHGGPASLLRCRNCGMLLRDEEAEARYENDLYDQVLMDHLYPRYLCSFENKRHQYQPLLRDHAEVIEVGSHLGAFLQAAEGWRWFPTGLDIGESTVGFARRRGLSLKRLTLEDYSPKLRRPEAVFIWNCFEQLEDPISTLRRSHELLDRHGLLVVRVPNGNFYRKLRQQFEMDHSKQALLMLGYNNLLGFPYLHGYTTSALKQLLRRNHFHPILTNKSSLLTPPYPYMSQRISEEWNEARIVGESSPEFDGPWIEMVGRKL